MSKLHTALKRLHLRPVAYYPIYARIMGSVAGGVILSQLLYWAAKYGECEFYKTDEDIIAETGCEVRELRRAKQRLRELGIVSVEVKGLPARTWYRVNWDALLEAIASENLTEDPSVPSPEDECSDDGEQMEPETVRTSSYTVYELAGTQCTNLLEHSVRTIHNVQETRSRRLESGDNSTAYADAEASASEQIFHPEKPPKQPSLRLRIEHPPPEKPKKPNYYHEVRNCFLAVLGEGWKEDALAIRACLSAWKQVREAGTSAEEIRNLWAEARSRASPEVKEKITLLWVLNNAEKARKLAAYVPKQEPMPSYYQAVCVPPEWGGLR